MITALPYLPVAAGMVLAGAGIGILLGKRIPALSADNSRNAMWIATALFFLVYVLLLGYKLQALQLGMWDFGIYDSLLHNAVSGGGLMQDYRGLYDHFSPLILLLAPFYFLYDTPFWLVFFQPLALALAAPLLYKTARRYFPTGNGALLLTLMYLLNPYCSRMALYDFHSEVFFPLLFFAAFFFYSRNRFGRMLLCLAAAPLLKEDFTIPVAAAGLLLLTRRRTRKHGIAAVVIAAFWALFALKVYFPHILGADYWHYDRYALIGADFSETADNVLVFVKRFFTLRSAAVLLSTLLPFALLPCLNLRALVLLLLPTVAIQLVSSDPHQQRLISHYSSAVIAVAPIAALWGMRSLRRMFRRRRKQRRIRPLLAAAAGIAVSVHIGFCDLPITRYYSYTDSYLLRLHPGILSLPLRADYWTEMGNRLDHAREVRNFFALLPCRPDQQAGYLNDFGLALPLLRRARVFDFEDPNSPERPDYLVFYRGIVVRNPETARRLERIQNDPGYRLYASPSGVLAFVRSDALEP